MSLLNKPMVILVVCDFWQSACSSGSIHGWDHGSGIGAVPSRWSGCGLQAGLRDATWRNNSSQGRIDARRNSEPCRGNQAVRAAAEEASLTSMLRPGALLN